MVRAADLRHSRRLRRSERPRRLAERSGLQTALRPVRSTDRRPGQPAHAVAVRERDRRPSLVPTAGVVASSSSLLPSTSRRALTLDIDTFDDPTHGQQQLTFFHGYYEQYQYQPRVITCAENDLVVMICAAARHGLSAALGADDDLEYLVTRLRQAWPDVRIHLRGDCGVRRAGDVRRLRTAGDGVHLRRAA